MHTDFYSLPEVYDVLHATGTAPEVQGLRRMARTFVRTTSAAQTWLEPACGTARYLRRLSARGIRTLGFDLRPEMIAYAKRESRGLSPHPRLFVADMRDFAAGRRLSRIDFAFNLINTIRHLGDDSAMLTHFVEVAGVLKPGGVYAVGVSLAAYGLEEPTEDTWSGRRGPLRVSQLVQYLPPLGRRGEASRAERVISHMTVTRGKQTEHIDSVYSLRSYDLAQWTGLVARSPFEVIGVTDNAGRPATPAEPGYFVFVLALRAAR